MRISLGTSGTTLNKRINTQIIGVPEGKEEEQEIENLLEKIMKGNLPNLAKEIHIQYSPGSTES